MRERRARKPRGRSHGCYLLEDRFGQYLVVSQKLQALAAFVAKIAPDAASRVSVTALYEIVDSDHNKVGGFAKHRWRLRFAPLEAAGDAFERERARFREALIVGQPECYTLESRGAS